MTGAPKSSYSTEESQLLRLRQQLTAREEVVKQLNRRLVCLELAQPIPEQEPDEGLVETYRQRVAELDHDLRKQQLKLDTSEAKRAALAIQLDELRALRDETDRLPAVRWSHHLARIKALAGRLLSR